MTGKTENRDPRAKKMCYNSIVKQRTEDGKGRLLSSFLQKKPGVSPGRSKERGGGMAKLSPKEERFCREYVIDYNGTQAAIRSGYKVSDAANRATRLLKKAEVSARVRELQQEMAQRLALSQDYVVIQLIGTYNECKDRDDPKNALKALELMGRHLGMFEKTKKQSEGGEKLEDLL